MLIYAGAIVGPDLCSKSFSLWPNMVRVKFLSFVRNERPHEGNLKLIRNVTAEKSRNCSKIPIIISKFSWKYLKLLMLVLHAPFVCQPFPVRRGQRYRWRSRWTLRYRYGNKRYFPACYSLLPLFNSLLKWSVWAVCNDKLLYSFKTR